MNKLIIFVLLSSISIRGDSKNLIYQFHNQIDTLPPLVFKSNPFPTKKKFEKGKVDLDIDTLNNKFPIKTPKTPSASIEKIVYLEELLEFNLLDDSTFILVNSLIDSLRKGEFISTDIYSINRYRIVIPSLLTPNADSYNDAFVILGIENYPNNEILIFSRWGSLLYSKKGYKNSDPWDATYNGKYLPEGIYFYVLKINDKMSQTGHIIIKR